MYRQVKSNIQILLVLLLAAATLIGISLINSGMMQPPLVSAQEPVETPSPIILSDEARDFFMQQVGGDLQAEANPVYNLSITKSVNRTTVNSGGTATFTIVIRNNRNVAATYVIFKDDIPAQMRNPAYQFPSDLPKTQYTDATTGTTTWMFTSIPANRTFTITITGQFVTSRQYDPVTNVAKVVPLFLATSAGQTKAAQASLTVHNPAGSGGLTFLPIIRLDPTPTPTPTPPIVLVYHEPFNSDEWIEFDVNGCRAENRDGQYWIRIRSDSDDNECLPPARNESKPERPFRTYGEFEVTAYHSEGESNASYGIFINGRGANNYYLFRIWPNNSCSSGGNWELIRNYEGDEDTLRSGSCEPIIKRGYGGGNTNVLKIRHSSDRVLRVYINGKEVGSYLDNSSRHLDDEATGIYARRDNREILIKFDDFKVYRIP